MKWNGVRASLCLVLVTACFIPHQRIERDPFDTPAPQFRSAFKVSWWRQLVPGSTFAEYAPRETATPLIDPDLHIIITTTRDGVVHGLNPDGDVRWSFPTHGRFVSGGQIRDGVAYIPGGDGRLYALVTGTGEKLWEYAASEELASSIAFSEDLILVASSMDTIFAVNAKTGKWVWQYRRDPPTGFTIRGVSTPVVRQGVVYVGFADGHLVALSAANGGMKWDRTLSTGLQFIDVDSTPVFDDAGTLYVAAYKDGIFALDSATGDTKWRKDVPGVTQLARYGPLLIASGTEEISAYTVEKGAHIWTTLIGQRAGRLAVGVGGYVVVPTAKALLFLQPSTGAVDVMFNPGKGVSAPPGIMGHEAYVLSNLGFLYALHIHPFVRGT